MDKVLLIVEDNPSVMDLYETAFKLNSFDVEKAYNGDEALQRLSGSLHKPAVILLDIMMSKMNGFDLLAKLKQNPELQRIPVVILSNLAQQHDVDKGLELGAVLYLVKSQYDPQEVVDRVTSVLQRYDGKSKAAGV
ncbi:MAG: hypothetical protein A3B23_03940 [Candidatus Colwellbacteria bacterium RIFCSPLOWO2_01_FULL_48_10]|uniref:Response regulatory domain-containing protein n=2 Tax=Bacteria candidate phyla TaxID=1783234 RepID=A0A1F5NZG9_9BACT|nr:MAG: hypothetical protein A2846_01775 [Candidatus Doudnabacteria bacterium RIFCSPHIGHO2_01_FULL_49_9]OGY60102.1 MAG: hypothetical protein A3B23_03940 [Candidatus Colwellbacteria bacterium RIFCSPLOWO2_01_FULL_48_10]